MTNKTLTLGSLFDGSGGFPLGGLLAGITPVWASEIEPFPIRVTTKRLPFMKHYGNISAMDGGKIEPADIITFGSPCQDMSVAGRRDGLDGKRSSLFYEAVRIIKEMRCATGGRYPRYIVWENVPGAFSSNKGEDFKAVLEAVIGIAEPNAQVPMPEKARWPYTDLYLGDGWSVAYRTLDAQYWGVPQRRRRIYLVADFAGRGAGTKQQTFVLQGSMIGRDDKNDPQGDGINEVVSFTLNTIDRHAVYTMTTGSFAQVSEDKAPTVLARDYKDPTAVCYGIGRDTFNQGQNAKFAPTFEEELQPTLVAKGPGAIQSGYTVRRLTPTECARLQGFPDNGCADLGTENRPMKKCTSGTRYSRPTPK